MALGNYEHVATGFKVGKKCYKAFGGSDDEDYQNYNNYCDDGNFDDDDDDLSWFSGHDKFNWKHCNGLLLRTVGL